MSATNNEVIAVKELGQKIGYGYLMHLAAAMWRHTLRQEGVPDTGAFVAVAVDEIKPEFLNSIHQEVRRFDAMILNALQKTLSKTYIACSDGSMLRIDSRQFEVNADLQVLVLALDFSDYSDGFYTVFNQMGSGTVQEPAGKLSQQEVPFRAVLTRSLEANKWDFKAHPDPEIVFIELIKL